MGDAFQTTADIVVKIEQSESLIRKLMDISNTPGLSCGLMVENKVIFARGYGYSTLEAKSQATASTIYCIGSVSKCITSAACCLLASEGVLDLGTLVLQ